MLDNSLMKMVQIKWLDAHACFASWQDPNDISKVDFTCESVGWLLPLDLKPGWHVVVLSRTYEGLVGDGVAIPDGMVIEVNELSPVKKKTQ